MGQNHGDSKNILQIHDRNHIFILLQQNKVVSLQCDKRPPLPIRASPPLWGEFAIGR
jgi:hypothetical protein